MIFKSDEHITILGKTGTGKTIFIRDTLLPKFERYIVFVYDDKDLFSRRTQTTVTNLKDLLQKIKKGFSKILYMHDYKNEQNLFFEFDRICQILLAIGNFRFVNDEIDDVAKTNMLSPHFAQVLRKGRRVNVGLVSAIKRVVNIDRLLYTQTTHFFIFVISDFDIYRMKTYFADITKIQNLKFESYQCAYFKNENFCGYFKSIKKI